MSPSKPRLFAKAKTPDPSCIRRLHQKLLTVISLMTLTAVLSASVPAQSNQLSSAAASANNFAFHQPILAAGFWDFLSFLGINSSDDKEEQPDVTPNLPKDGVVDSYKDVLPSNLLAGQCNSTGVTRMVPEQFPTIQAAINASNAAIGGDKISVLAGTYQEQIVVNKCLTLTGRTSQQDVIIQAPPTLNDSAIPGVNAKSVVEVRSGSYATVSNVIVTGPVTFGSNRVYGMLVGENSTLMMTNSKITNIREAGGFNGGQSGIGILVGDAVFNTIGAINFNNVTVDDYNKNGIVVGKAGSDAKIANSTITGFGATTLNAQNGIVIRDGATATLTGNTVSGNNFTSNTVAAGILSLNGGATSISGGNTFTNNSYAVYNAGDSAATYPAYTVSGNTFNANPKFGIFLRLVSGTFSDNFIDGSNVGINSRLSDTAVVQITSNSITSAAGAGIFFNDVSSTTPATTLADVDVHFNRIVGNATGIQNNSTSAISAENNFFGCNSGPSTTITGCDSIDGTQAGLITATPFLILQAAADDSSVGDGEESNITATIVSSVGGATATAFPDGVPISFTPAPGTNGSITSADTTLTDGVATAVFTGGTANGGDQTETVTAKVDNALAPVEITVEDEVKPTPTVSLASGQPATTSNQPINFTVMFDEVVTGFASSSGVSFTGSTATTSTATVLITDSGDGQTYNVKVTGITGSGNVTLSVPADVAQDTAGVPNSNNASTNSATVNYISPAPRDCSTIAPLYNFFTEFSIGSNPNCEYSYGYTTGSDPNSDFNLYTKRAAAATPGNPSDQPRWYRSEADQFNVPGVFQDTNALILHPGLGSERSVVRFTVGDTLPTGGTVPAGFYKVTGGFSNGNNATTDVLIILRSGATSTTLFSGNINGSTTSQPFDIPVTLASGDSIDFSVGDGNNGYSSDSTLLSATLTPVALTPETLYGLTSDNAGQNLVSFSSTNPNVATSVAITGVPSIETLVGIDFRPRNGVLYAISSDGTTGRVYTINALTGLATAINGGTNTIRTGPNADIALSGTNFGVDFNPAVDRIRVISGDSDQSLAVNPDTGITAINGSVMAANSVTAAAYTNNTFPAPASTVLYDIDADTDQLYTQNTSTGALTSVGAGLGVNASAVNGFDISSAGSTPTTPVNNAYASFTTNNADSTSDLYTINLTTGAASRVGKIGTTENSATGLSITGLTVAPAMVGGDATFPTVTSIAYGTPATSPTNANSVDFAVTFSELVNGVDTGDFALATTMGSIADASITSVTPTCTMPATSCATYTVTVNTGTGDGTVGLNLVDNDTIIDASNNQLGGAGIDNGNFTGQVYTIDKTTPTIVSITSAPMTPTNMAMIQFTVTFSETLASCNAAGFTVNNGDIAATSPELSGATCIVDVRATGSPVILTVSAGAATDTAGNDNADTDSLSVVYDNAAPTVTIVGNPPADNTSPVNFTVTFSELVTDFDASDVTVTGSAFTTGTPNVTVTAVGIDGTTYDVAVSGMNMTGAVTAQITGSATDASGNPSTDMPSATVQYTVVDSPVTVNPTNTKTNAADSRTVWTGFDDNTNQFIDPSYVEGPGVGAAGPPLGTGSARLNTTATGKYLFASGSFNGTPLSQITELSYSSYAVDPSNAANLPSLQIGIDFDSTDGNLGGFQGRLVFEPTYNTAAPNQPTAQSTWQRWNATNGNYWLTQNPPSSSITCTQASRCTLAQILTAYPRMNIPTTNLASGLDFGFVGFRSTGGGANAVENYVDAFTIGVNSANTTFNFEAQPPTLSIGDATVMEGNGTTTTTATFKVTLSQASQLVTSFTVNTADGTTPATAATAPSDYTAINNQTFTIAAGATFVDIPVTVNGDDVFEANETFTVNLSNAVNAAILDDSGLGTITNDEPARTVSIANTTGGNETGLVPNTFTVTLSGASASVVTVDYATSDNTPTASATAGNDYTAANGTLTFNPGDPLTKTFTVATLQDAIVEGTETFNATLSMPTNATITGTNPAIGTIADNDNCAYTINGSPASAPFTGGNMMFTVTVNSGCVVNAASNSPFITGVTVGTDNGTSTRTITYTVADNTSTAMNNGMARQGTITVTVPAAPLPQSTTGTFVVNQAAAPVLVDIPDDLQAINGATLAVPVNVISNTTGRNIISFDFIVSYDPAVFGTPTAVSNTAFSSGFTVGFTPLLGNRVQVSGFSDTPLTGSGTLVNINFPIVGSNPNCGALTFNSFIFNDGNASQGDPVAMTSGGQACVISGAITGRVIYGNNRTPSDMTNPNGTDDSGTARPVPNTTLTGVASTTGQPTVTGTSMCPDGMYSLMGFGTGTYTVTPSKGRGTEIDNPRGNPPMPVRSITSQDASRIQQAVLGSVTLTAIQIQAADVSKNNAVTSFDAALIQQYILNQAAASADPRNNTGKWEFDPTSRVYTSTAANMVNQDYAAILLGDVTGNWVSPCPVPTLATAKNRSGKTVTDVEITNDGAAAVSVTLPNSSTSSGTNFDIPITVGDLTGQNVTSYDFDILYDPAVIQPQTTQTDKNGTISSGLTVGSTIVEPGRLRVSAFGGTPVSGSGVLLKLKFQAVGANGTSSNLSFAPFMFNEGLPSNMSNTGQIRLLSTTASSATISGRVASASGKALSGVTVILTDSRGATRSARTNLRGIYQFDQVPTGETYTINVSNKLETGNPQIITPNGNLSGVDFIF